ncbi:MAG: hypothetical protein WA631_00300, partial [Nitrososphaeraceae archaeon]
TIGINELNPNGSCNRAENLRIKPDIGEPKLTDHEVLIKVKRCGVNPIDAMVTSGSWLNWFLIHKKVHFLSLCHLDYC